ncbi:MAG: hypothetical protein M3P14_00545 [Chloroflexota bacterium]|nr:hypothetical protein [Chloroflexota bacterium]
MATPDVSAAVAVGLLGPDGPWAGFVSQEGGFRLAFGGPDGAVWTSREEGAARRTELLAVAMAYYEEALDAPPTELEATQADLAQLARWLSSREVDPLRRALLREAVDAIDDGLAGDVVIARLSRAVTDDPPDTDEQADPVDLLVSRFEALSAPSA